MVHAAEILTFRPHDDCPDIAVQYTADRRISVIGIELADGLIEVNRDCPLQPKECDVLALGATGMSEQASADFLAIAPKTITNYRAQMPERLEATRFTEAICGAFNPRFEALRVRLPMTHRPELTARQQDVMLGMARGLGNVAIGKELNISRKTVEFHASAILHKFVMARNRHAVAALAFASGMVEWHDDKIRLRPSYSDAA